MRLGNRFRTSDGYTLLWDGNAWVDNLDSEYQDMTFDADSNQHPIDDTGAALDGDYLPEYSLRRHNGPSFRDVVGNLDSAVELAKTEARRLNVDVEVWAFWVAWVATVTVDGAVKRSLDPKLL